MKDLGELIRARREAAGMQTQKQLADAVSKSSSWISRLESGVAKEMPTPGDLKLISDALGVSQAEMLAAAGYEVETGNEGDSEAVSTVRAILEGREFTDKQIRQLATMVRGMVEMMEG